MKHARALATSAISASALLSACAHRQHLLENDPTALAAVRANIRVVNGETTWVTRGSGYELVGRTKNEVVAVQSQLDREAAIVHRVFPSDSLTHVIVAVRRATPEGKPFVPAAPTPSTVREPVVEVVIADATAKKDQDKNRTRTAGASGLGMLGEGALTEPVVRAWLSGRASMLTKKPARSTQANGEVEDSRVPAWANEVIASLASDSLVDKLTTELESHLENVISVSNFFTMDRPEPALQAAQRGGDARGSDGQGAGGMGGRGGGMGGMGGMGGRSRGGGMGGRGGGSNGRSSGERETPGLEGAALFEAQSVVFGRYLAHEGYDLIGALVDGQIMGKTADDVLTSRGMSVGQMDTEWRRWLFDRAQALVH
jgi:hypothetical protein